jgi:hypothetical protein
MAGCDSRRYSVRRDSIGDMCGTILSSQLCSPANPAECGQELLPVVGHPAGPRCASWFIGEQLPFRPNQAMQSTASPSTAPAFHD